MATRPDSVGGWSFFSLFLYPCRQGPLKIKALGDSLNLVTLEWVQRRFSLLSGE